MLRLGLSWAIGKEFLTPQFWKSSFLFLFGDSPNSSVGSNGFCVRALQHCFHTALCCTALHCTALCTALYGTVHCTVQLQSTAFTLHCTVLHCWRRDGRQLQPCEILWPLQRTWSPRWLEDGSGSLGSGAARLLLKPKKKKLLNLLKSTKTAKKG